MKSILVDIYKIKDLYSGLGQFSLNIAQELANQIPPDTKLHFLIPKNNKISFARKNIQTQESSLLTQLFPSANKKYHIWHSLHQFPSTLPHPKAKWILTIHDLNFLIEKKGKKRQKYLNRLQRNINRADYITTISNYSKEQIEKHCELNGKQIQVIYNGIDATTNIEQKQPSFITGQKFFFSIGIFNQKKNFETLIPLMQHFKHHQLIIAGNNQTDYGNQIREQIQQSGLQDRVILPGKISHQEKQWLYSQCEAFLFPSLAEGFGMPVIEAMKAGRPVFLSRYTSLPEIGGSMAFYFNNFQPEHMYQLISSNLEKVNNNPQRFSEQIKNYANKFNWQTCVNQYLELYKSISVY